MIPAIASSAPVSILSGYWGLRPKTLVPPGTGSTPKLLHLWQVRSSSVVQRVPLATSSWLEIAWISIFSRVTKSPRGGPVKIASIAWSVRPGRYANVFHHHLIAVENLVWPLSFLSSVVESLTPLYYLSIFSLTLPMLFWCSSDALWCSLMLPSARSQLLYAPLLLISAVVVWWLSKIAEQRLYVESGSHLWLPDSISHRCASTFFLPRSLSFLAQFTAFNLVPILSFVQIIALVFQVKYFSSHFQLWASRNLLLRRKEPRHNSSMIR